MTAEQTDTQNIEVDADPQTGWLRNQADPPAQSVGR